MMELSPPFGKFLVTLTHFLDVIARIGCVSQHLYDVCYDEIPFLLRFIPNRPYLIAFKKFNVAHDSIFKPVLIHFPNLNTNLRCRCKTNNPFPIFIGTGSFRYRSNEEQCGETRHAG